jgi:alpha-beta hydrolase superfamily lysophospholipase
VQRPLSFVVLVAVLATSCVLAVRAVARRTLFPTSEVPVAALPGDLRETACIAADGAVVRMLESAPPAAHARTVVYFHNNRETIEARADLARALAARGLGAVLVEYRGYGRSPGSPTEAGLYLDAEAALDALAARGVGPERVVLWGTSLGSGVAAEMARRGRGARLVLMTPYTSIPELVTNVAPFVPARTLVPDAFDTGSKTSAIGVPTLVIHGDADEIVPFAMGRAIARAIRGARLLAIAGGRHGDLFAREGPRLYEAIAELAR